MFYALGMICLYSFFFFVPQPKESLSHVSPIEVNGTCSYQTDLPRSFQWKLSTAHFLWIGALLV